MEDELEDRLFYQTYVSHMKLLSRLTVGIPPTNFAQHLAHFCRLLRVYLVKPEVLILSVCFVLILFYIQAVDVWSRSLVNKIRLSVSGTAGSSKAARLLGDLDSSSTWEMQEDNVAVYAVQGRRPRMEDRFVVNKNLSGTGVDLYAVFDGHGGEFAANYARDNLINSLNSRIIELKKLIEKGPVREVIGKPPPSPRSQRKASVVNLERKPSFGNSKKQGSVEEGTKRGGTVTDPLLLEKIDSIANRQITREVRRGSESPAPGPAPPLSSYIDNTTSSINFGKLLTDEVLAADRLLVQAAKKNFDVAGTTALIAIIEGSKLVVANVGDSRGVMCDFKGRAIPLSFDHKPQQSREKKRIEEAGGSVSFDGVWRVSGILATSRAMGDYPLKDRRLVIADPDVITFDLSDHRPEFLMLASDGLWDTFSNEEAVAFVRSRLLSEPHFGAKSITLQSFYRGSLDNITVLVINLSNHIWPSSS